MRPLLAVFSVALIGPSHGTLPFLAPSDQAQQVADTLVVLRVTGDVENPLSLTMADIAALPDEELVAEIHGRSVAYRRVKLNELLLLAGPPVPRTWFAPSWWRGLPMTMRRSSRWPN